jgi:glycosyltransferase involved in cell wall biosynthesis
MINPHNPDFTLNPAHPLRENFAQHLISWKDSPVLTIVTPFYNSGAVFHETAQSIFNQSLQEWEWLIINDGSTNLPSIHILDEYRNRDARIRVIDHSENRGLSVARNTGFSHARSEFVLLLDSDDLLEPTAAEKWWWFLETHPQYSFIASYHVAFGGLNYLWTGGFHDGAMNAERNRVSMMCVVRKSVHKAVGGFDETIRGGLEDWEFWMRCAAHGYWGATVPEYLAWYRLREDHSDRWENLQETRLTEFRSLLQNKYPDLYHGGFPNLTETIDFNLTTVNLQISEVNQLAKTGPHLLMILPWLEMGGAERFTLNLMDQLINQGWIISIVTTASSRDPWLYEFEKRTPFVFILPNFIPIKDYPRFLCYLIQSRNFDAIFIQGSYEGYRLLPTLGKLFPAIPIVDYLHFVTPDWMQGGFPRLSLLYRDFIDLSFTSCNQVRDWMVEAGGNPNRLVVSYIGVDPDIWKPDITKREQVRAGLGIELNDTVILYAARLEAQKQPDVFAETLCKLTEKGDRFHALVAGEGSLMAQLKEKLQECRLQERVHILGSVPIEKMPAIMAASDIFFLPSQNEGISQALYEAMACGLVVVSAQVGGQGELVSDDCGILRSPASPQDETTEYANILHQLICDTPIRQQMSQASRQHIRNKFTLDLMGECTLNNLSTTIANKKRNNPKPVTELEKQSINREVQYLVEFLQARQELQQLNAKYSVLVQPKSASHWFYLWIRQVFLPVSEHVKTSRPGQIIVGLQKWLKRTLIKE